MDDMINDIMQSVYSRQLGPIMAHKFLSPRLLELFSCAFIYHELSRMTEITLTNYAIKILIKVFQSSFANEKSLKKSLERDTFG